MASTSNKGQAPGPPRLQGEQARAKRAIAKAAQRGQAVLHWAALEGSVADVNALIRCGVDIDSLGTDGSTGLLFAAQEGKARFVETFLANGASVNATMKDGATALHAAAQRGCLEIVANLLAAGANPHLTMRDGATALHLASQFGKAGVVHALLAHGANPHAAVRGTGNTALQFATHFGHPEISGILQAATLTASAPVETGCCRLLDGLRLTTVWGDNPCSNLCCLNRATTSTVF